MLQLRGYSWVTGLGKLNGAGLEICMHGGKVNAAGLGFNNNFAQADRWHLHYSG